ncbi:MAG TPA: NAD-dependent epimerase/dehydratase family protein [Planctomycetaceae bacterium]|nr:NAD-dependent epimerase/dehydratase family protein [Planctomycetaceae bacterium]
MSDWYAGRRVLITGGLGFLGGHLAVRLVACGAMVTLVDLPESLSTPHRERLGDAANRVAYTSCDVRDTERLSPHFANHDVMFWLAAHGGHLASMQSPLLDLDVNCRSVAAAVEVCRTRNPGLRFVFTSTRQVYGRTESLPVDERHRTRPPDVNAINKLAAEHYLRLYSEVYGLPTVSLRLTNVYGPQMALDDPEQGVAGVLVGQALRGEPLTLYGGDQVREFTYVDDVVDALLLAGLRADARGECFNLGASRAHSLREFAAAVGRIVPVEIRTIPWPAERQAIDTGDIVCDSSRFHQATGWRPATDLETGLRTTLQHFQQQRVRRA